MAFSTGKVDDAGAPPSPPPSSSPPVITPAVMDEGPPSATTTLETWYLEDDSLDASYHLRPLSRGLSGSSFLQTLDRLLLASVQQKRRSTHVVTTSLPLHNALDRSVSGCPARRVSRSRSSARLSTGPPDSDLELLGRSSLSAIDAYTHSAVTRKRPRSRPLRPRATDYDHDEHSGPSTTNKKRKFCDAQRRPSARGFLRRRTANPLSVGLSGVFKLCYAKGPGSLRRAESLRVELPTNAPEEEVLNEVSVGLAPLQCSMLSALSRLSSITVARCVSPSIRDFRRPSSLKSFLSLSGLSLPPTQPMPQRNRPPRPRMTILHLATLGVLRSPTCLSSPRLHLS
ncbi:hypothetical protein LXA43DRAFT_339366 [Ganoderma leucocontextum]|nr:hypothetical protein LXA43DRAFT_339366 [Ganoderma leucocontextum]